MLIFKAFPYIKWSSNWKELLSMVESCTHVMKAIQVTWHKPPCNLVKINIDRSALDNLGRIWARGILRDHRGKLIYASAAPLGFYSNNQAKVQAAVLGITWCIQHGYSRVLLEVDLELRIQWLRWEFKPPWSIKDYINELQDLINFLDYFQCKHIFREADYPLILSLNIVIRLTGPTRSIIFSNFLKRQEGTTYLTSWAFQASEDKS
ncbi:uncharacterized protein LOC129892820 [Solanum dulcamara]|uniref:uncharacterized protein LOC129892820 n=1 Tax=Solanum dulcamara TaxID=45834 RepID=UPI002484E8C9|nr:uncharacterized protein LOC129892820 [Solanum dulcamara]